MVIVNPTKCLIEDIAESKEKTAGGIYIPASVKAPTMQGKIVVKGDGTKEIEIKYKVGDIVLFHPNAGTKLMWKDKEYRLVDVAEVFLGGDKSDIFLGGV